MKAFDSKHYVPVLLTKAGEQDALKALTVDDKTTLRPLLTIHPIDWDYENDQPAKGIDVHLAKLPQNLVKSWGKQPAFLDATHVETEVMANGEHPIEWMIGRAQADELELVPALAPENGLSYRDAVRRLLALSDDSDVCLRLRVEDWPVAPSTVADDLLADLGVTPERVHLVLDLRDQTSSAAYAHVLRALPQLIHANRWRSITLAASAMLQLVPPGKSVHEIKRSEWVQYRSLASGGGEGRVPTFGDYGIAHPDLMVGTDPRLMQISAKLKYTAEDEWLIGRGDLFKGHGGRSGGGAMIQPVAREVVAHAGYTPNHCDGETWIQDAAANSEAGAPRTWIKIGTLHHVKRVLDQLSSL